MSEDSGIQPAQRIGFGLSFIAFPLMLLAGFLRGGLEPAGGVPLR